MKNGGSERAWGPSYCISPQTYATSPSIFMKSNQMECNTTKYMIDTDMQLWQLKILLLKNTKSRFIAPLFFLHGWNGQSFNSYIVV